MSRRRPWSLLSALIFLPAVVSLAAAARPKVVTAIGPLFCLTKNVAGSAADVENLIPPGASPHDYQLSPKDRARLEQASLIIFNGLEVDGVLAKRVTEAAATAAVLDAAQGLGERLIPARHTERSAFNPTGANSHFWLDPTLAAHAVTNIMQALARLDPGSTATYQGNALAYIARLEKLDKEISTAVAAFKATPIVTQHDAFPYFARRYGLQIAGVIQVVPEVPPSPKHLTRLQSTIREKKVRVIFTEPEAASSHAERIARDLKLKLAPLDPLESVQFTLTAYEDGMRRNLKALREALDAPVP